MLFDGPPSAFGPVGTLRLFPTAFVTAVFRLSGCSLRVSSGLSSTALGGSAMARGPLGNEAPLSTGDGADRALSTVPVDTGSGGGLFSLGYQSVVSGQSLNGSSMPVSPFLKDSLLPHSLLLSPSSVYQSLLAGHVHLCPGLPFAPCQNLCDHPSLSFYPVSMHVQTVGTKTRTKKVSQ